MPHRFASFILYLGAASFLVGCGGGSPDPMPQDMREERSLNLAVDLDLQGFVASDGMVFVTDSYGWIGDNGSGVGFRAVCGFPLKLIPAGVTLAKATLVVYLARPFELGMPHQDLGNIVVDLVDLGGSLGPEDYSGSLLTDTGVLSDMPGVGTRTLDVTGAVRVALEQGLPSADLRLRFVLRTDNDMEPDLTFVNGSGDPAMSGVTPVLQVTFLQ